MKLIDKIIGIYTLAIGTIVLFTGLIPSTLDLVKYVPQNEHTRSSLQTINVNSYDNFFLSIAILIIGLAILGLVKHSSIKNL